MDLDTSLNYNYGRCNQFYEKKIDNEEYRYKYKGNVLVQLLLGHMNIVM
jgi:hypothetical protein